MTAPRTTLQRMLAAACLRAILCSLPVITLAYSPVSTVLPPISSSLLCNPSNWDLACLATLHFPDTVLVHATMRSSLR